MVGTEISVPLNRQPTVGSPLVVNCTVSIVSGVKSDSVMISWMRPGGGSIMNDSRVMISPTTSSGNNYTNNLQFNYLMEGDEGTYTCNTMILESSVSSLLVLSPFISKLSILHSYKKIKHHLSLQFLSTNFFICNALKYFSDVE